jgi:hypothetical protein
METSVKLVRAGGRRCFGERYPLASGAAKPRSPNPNPNPNRLTAINPDPASRITGNRSPGGPCVLVRRASRAGRTSHDLLFPNTREGNWASLSCLPGYERTQITLDLCVRQAKPADLIERT